MSKLVYFDEYIPFTLITDADGTQHEHPLDLDDLFKQLSEEPQKRGLKELFGEKYRLHVCKYHENDALWEIQVLHLRDSILPGIADEEREFELLTLPDGKYPAESCTMIYIPQSTTIFFQRNSLCMSTKRLGYYLQSMLPEGTKMVLKPVISGNKIDMINNYASYKKLVLLATVGREDEEPTSRLGRLLYAYKGYGAPYVQIEISTGRKRNSRLKAAEISELVREAYADNDVEKLRVNMAKDAHSEFGWVDLMEDRDGITVKMEYSKDDPISHDRLFEACIEKYRALS